MEWVSGLYAAVAALAATRVVRHGGPGELVDLSMSEVANTTGTTAADLMDSLRGRPNPATPGRSFETPSIEPTSDGYVGFNTNTRTQFDSFLLMIERPDLIEDGVLGVDRAPGHELGGVERDHPRLHDRSTRPPRSWRWPPSCASRWRRCRRSRGRRVRAGEGARLARRRPHRHVPRARRGRGASTARAGAAAATRAAPRRAHRHDRPPSAEAARDPRPTHAAAARRQGRSTSPRGGRARRRRRCSPRSAPT